MVRKRRADLGASLWAGQRSSYADRMRIGKPLLLIITPIGVAAGLYEAHRLAGGLVFLMVAMLMVVTAAIATVVLTIRREKAEEAAQKAAERSTDLPRGPDDRDANL